MSSTRNIFNATALLTAGSVGVAYGVKKLADRNEAAFKQLPEKEQAAWAKHMPADKSADAFGAMLRHQAMLEAKIKVEEELAQEKESAVSNRM